jgi:hypothetical protein
VQLPVQHCTALPARVQEEHGESGYRGAAAVSHSARLLTAGARTSITSATTAVLQPYLQATQAYLAHALPFLRSPPPPTVLVLEKAPRMFESCNHESGVFVLQATLDRAYNFARSSAP